MSTRYGQKTAPSSIKRVSPSFVSYNRNDPVYNGVALPIRTETPTYSRPSDYRTMPAIDNTEQKVALLVFISDNNSNFLAFPDSVRHIEILGKDFPIDFSIYSKIYQCISPFQGASGRYREFYFERKLN